MGFKLTSYFHPNRQTERGVPIKHVAKVGINTPAVPSVVTPDNATLENWSHRLANCASEAQDEQLGPLESDLLDLRDEIVHVLHQRLL